MILMEKVFLNNSYKYDQLGEETIQIVATMKPDMVKLSVYYLVDPHRIDTILLNDGY